jgi:hypothetical protein
LRARRGLAEPCLHVAGGLVAGSGIRLQRALDHRDERRGEIRPKIPQLAAIAPLVRACQLIDRSCGDGELAGDEVKQQHAEAVQIALHRCGLPREHFRREVQRRPGDLRAAGVSLQFLARSEIHQDGAPAALTQDVLRLHVTVQQAGAVDGGKRGT